MRLDLRQIISKFNQLDIKIRSGIFIAVLFGILILDFFTLISIQLGALQKIETDVQTMKQDIEHVKNDLQRSNQMSASVKNSQTELEKLEVKIRPLAEQSVLLENISRKAREAGVKIEQLAPQSEAQSLSAAGPVKYYSFPVVVQATSDYHAFGRFMGQLEGANLFFTVSNLSISEIEGDVKNHTTNTILKFILSDKSIDKK